MKLITILTFLIPLSVFAQKNIGYDNIEGEIDSIFKYDYEQGYQSVLNIFEKEEIDKILPQLGVLKITEIALKDGKEINQELFDNVYWCDCLRYKDSIALVSSLGFQAGIGIGVMGHLSNQNYQAFISINHDGNKNLRIEQSDEPIDELELILTESNLILSKSWIDENSPLLEWKLSGFSQDYYEKRIDGDWIKKKFSVDLHFRCLVFGRN
ncbi:hypothetical protein [Lewinella cohaerens]|uniref:hypothetical protein n=1 Tax=Lewinella cohaerens TaxID=70995 RepID=UPI00035E6E53|nr:hypothetical protein [Lewinella cohaerens]